MLLAVPHCLFVSLPVPDRVTVFFLVSHVLQDCCKKIYGRQGMAGFYGGMTANIARALPEATIQYACYETLKTMIHNLTD